MKGEFLIYKITNLINGKVYIGQTTMGLKLRWAYHSKYRVHCTYVGHAIGKYGVDSFKIEEIHKAVDKKEQNDLEEYYITLYDSMNPEKGYNLRAGGDHTTFSEATKKKLRAARLGTKLSEETKQKMSKAHTGRVVSEETRRKIGDANRGRKFSDEAKANMGRGPTGKPSWNAGKSLTEEHKANLKKSHTPESNARRLESRRINKELKAKNNV